MELLVANYVDSIDADNFYRDDLVSVRVARISDLCYFFQHNVVIHDIARLDGLSRGRCACFDLHRKAAVGGQRRRDET